ncbi:ribosomal protein S18-alanine N-acetyltransferase [Actinoplanes derwentensis]|uniref:[SSU ribosomal protein S18P]-alanine acetyltransferase n=1 Tax=Actinoplanes derwentensis TaxID=113562 RepID=A0A1H2CKK3_9ACTN|nr:ribosomal protein S18-alanine N-acetyltransferase [Actinoplanes derwentensis]GID82695.1 ribosomal-protein-alanine acetyltransferase [Actinoplanes derwentensis]SDT71038.1 [SSU ribosomal protein S18P]-alanine acetyltransferase [Actinoplanes derwentensis]
MSELPEAVEESSHNQNPLAPARDSGGYAIERFRWWHIDEVLPIEEDLFGPEKWSPAMFWNELATRQFYLVAYTRTHDGVVGYAGLSVVDEDESWVQNIAVRRDAQRLGIGRGLLEALLAEAARQGTRKTLLEVAVDNAPAQKLYATYGFEPVGIRRGYYQPSNTDALVMMRDA